VSNIHIVHLSLRNEVLNFTVMAVFYRAGQGSAL